MPAQGAPRLGSEPTDGKHKSPPRIGPERLVALIKRYGYESFTASCSAVMDYAERLMRQVIAALPDGDYDARTMIDDLSTAQTRRNGICRLLLLCECAGTKSRSI